MTESSLNPAPNPSTLDSGPEAALGNPRRYVIHRFWVDDDPRVYFCGRRPGPNVMSAGQLMTAQVPTRPCPTCEVVHLNRQWAAS